MPDPKTLVISGATGIREAHICAPTEGAACTALQTSPGTVSLVIGCPPVE
jgi:hypothetical protein